MEMNEKQEKQNCREIKAIAHIRSEFPTKFGIPRQSGRVPSLQGRVILEPEYRNPQVYRGLEEYSHIWLLWEFSQNVEKEWSPLVRPPRLGGNAKKGVFATRSPFRPNSIGLSCVRLEKISMEEKEGPVLYVSGADLMDGTPIYDIKPYIPAADCQPQAAGGFSERVKEHKLQVEFPGELLERLPWEQREAVMAVLADDPRPGYQEDPDRKYGMPFGSHDIHFRVEGERLLVFDVTEYRL